MRVASWFTAQGRQLLPPPADRDSHSTHLTNCPLQPPPPQNADTDTRSRYIKLARVSFANFNLIASLVWRGDNFVCYLKTMSQMCQMFVCSESDQRREEQGTRSSSSLSSSYISHTVGPLVDPFRSHVSRSLLKVCYDSFCQLGSSITLGNLFRGILFTCCIQLLLYSSNLSKIGVILNSFALCAFVM